MKKVFSIVGLALLVAACQPQVANGQRKMDNNQRPMDRNQRVMEKDRSEMPGPTMRDGRNYLPNEEPRGVYNPNDLNGRNASRVRMSETGGTTPGRYTPRYE